MELLRFAAEGLQLLSPDASQMPPQPQAPKCLPNGSQMSFKWLPKMLFGVSRWGHLRKFHQGSAWFCVEKLKKYGLDTETP